MLRAPHPKSLTALPQPVAPGLCQRHRRSLSGEAKHRFHHQWNYIKQHRRLVEMGLLVSSQAGAARTWPAWVRPAQAWGGCVALGAPDKLYYEAGLEPGTCRTGEQSEQPFLSAGRLREGRRGWVCSSNLPLTIALMLISLSPLSKESPLRT